MAGLVLPLQFGMFHLIPCVTMCLVMTIVFIEATGMFLALGAMIGAIFNTFSYVSYSQNRPDWGDRHLQPLGLRDRRGQHAGLGPDSQKMAFLVASVPQCVLGGDDFIMFGMVAATGIKIVATVDYLHQRNNMMGQLASGHGRRR